MLPVEVLESIAAWRCLTEAEQVSRLRECVVDEVVGNMRMEGQPVSAEWESAARRRPADPWRVVDHRNLIPGTSKMAVPTWYHLSHDHEPAPLPTC
jgi:hypothetical protein